MKCPFCNKHAMIDKFWRGWFCDTCGVGKYLAKGEIDVLPEINSGYQTRGGFDVWWKLVPAGKMIVRNERIEL